MRGSQSPENPMPGGSPAVVPIHLGTDTSGPHGSSRACALVVEALSVSTAAAPTSVLLAIVLFLNRFEQVSKLGVGPKGQGTGASKRGRSAICGNLSGLTLLISLCFVSLLTLWF